MEGEKKCYFCKEICTNKNKEYKQGAADYYLCKNCGLYGIPNVILADIKYNNEEIRNICAEWLRKNNKNNITEPFIISTSTIQTILQDVNKK